MIKERKSRKSYMKKRERENARPDATISKTSSIIILQSGCDERSQRMLKLAVNQLKESTVRVAIPKRNLSVRRSPAVMAPLQVGHW
jgi:hypothetical protein